MAKITIKQHDITDCGAACLASISSHFNLQIPIARIQQYKGTDDCKGIILPSFGVQEMSAKEIKETGGGFLWFAAAAIGIGIFFVVRGIVRRNQ